MRTVYLIDSENVADHWIGRIQLKTVNDRIIVFWSRNCKGIGIWLIPEILRLYPADQLEFIECYTGLNSMDFHIVAKLGQLTSRSSKSRFVVVSDDTGYDGVISFLHNNGANVVRMAGLSAMRNVSHIPEALTPDPELVLSYQSDDEKASSNDVSQSKACSDVEQPMGIPGTEQAPKAVDAKKKPKLQWGVNSNGIPYEISVEQKQIIAKKLNQFMQKNQDAMRYRQSITDILETAVYPSKPNAVRIYERLIKVPHAKVNKMAAVYRAMKQQLLPALDEVLAH